MNLTESMKRETEGLLDFLDSSPTAGWAGKNISSILENEGFVELSRTGKFNLDKGERFFLKKDDSTILAGIVGNDDPFRTGFRIAGAHTDSPGFRVKYSGMYDNEGYRQLGVEIYGGPLIASWTDRDLSLAGKVVFNSGGKVSTALWKSDRKLLRIAQLPIHLNRDVNDDGLKLGKEDHLPPIIGQSDDEDFSRRSIKRLIAKDFNVGEEEVTGFGLELFDTEPASTLGMNEEFFAAGSIDNLMACYAAINALIGIDETPDKTVIAVLFDNEEVGSNTSRGGASPFLQNSLERIGLSMGQGREEFLIALENSQILSVDGAHAVHPNYTENYEKDHKTHLNNGPVIKLNASQKYATDSGNTGRFECICEKAEIPYQVYVNRADKPCGSTIGPITSTRTGISTIDIGPPMLSMHSVREMGGVADAVYLKRAIREFLLEG